MSCVIKFDLKVLDFLTKPFPVDFSAVELDVFSKQPIDEENECAYRCDEENGKEDEEEPTSEAKTAGEIVENDSVLDEIFWDSGPRDGPSLVQPSAEIG